MLLYFGANAGRFYFFVFCFAEVIQANTTQVSFIFRASVYPLCRVHTSRDKPAVKLRDLFLYKASSAHDTYRRVQCNDLNLSHFSVFLWRVASVWRSECTQWKRLGRGRTLLSSTALTYFYWWLYEDLFRIIFRQSVEKFLECFLFCGGSDFTRKSVQHQCWLFKGESSEFWT